MSATSAPYGFKPVQKLGGTPYAGSVRHYKFDPAGYGTAVYNGALVYMKGTGYIELVSATGEDGTTNAFPAGTTLTGALGVFVGCSYVNSAGQTVFSQYYPASALNAVAYVVDDPTVVFQVQASSAIGQAEIGANVHMLSGAITTGSATTGNSTAAVNGTSLTTTAPFRIVGIAPIPGNAAGDAYTDIYVIFNPGWHSYTQVVGI